MIELGTLQHMQTVLDRQRMEMKIRLQKSRLLGSRLREIGPYPGIILDPEILKRPPRQDLAPAVDRKRAYHSLPS
ncbi:hypothetical protein D3C76_1733490 [compost metagenome]